MRARVTTAFRRQRMAALGLAPALGDPASPASALDVVRALGALQAQDHGSGVWSLGVRSGLTAAELAEAVDRREIVRTWPMRGTIHWVAAEDARWMCRLLASPRSGALASRYAHLGITEADLERAGELFETHLREPMSRPDVVSLLVEHGIDPTDQRAYHLVGHHCMTGLLCQGPLIGRQPSFVLIDTWVPHPFAPEREEAMATVVERYVRGHGPMTENDAAGWMLRPLGFTREALALLGDRLVREEVDGTTWLTHVDAGPASTAARPDAGVHLLPQWDELLLGYTTREVSLPPEHVRAVVPGRNMVFKPTLVVDGQVAGTWRRVARRGVVLVEVSPFAALPARRQRQLEVAAQGYARFLGTDVELVVRDPDAA